MRYTISEMASLLGVTTHTLRYYEKMGLIRPEVNEETGYRYYTVTDTRRFNLCRELRAAELSLEECRELIGSPSVEQSDEMFARQAARLRRRQVLDELSIRFLEKMQEQYRTLEQDAGRVWVQNFPEMWRLTFSQEEEASRDRELQQEKAEWLECMPAARWASRLPRRVMEQFRVGRNEYDYGLMMEADAARRLGLQRTRHVEVVCGGDYLVTVWKKDYRGSFGWDSLETLHDEIVRRSFRAVGETTIIPGRRSIHEAFPREGGAFPSGQAPSLREVAGSLSEACVGNAFMRSAKSAVPADRNGQACSIQRLFPRCFCHLSQKLVIFLSK